MPKYIRTEKGIYELVEDSNKEWGKQIVVKFPKNLNMKLADVKDQIIEQADTIEELCDVIVETKGHTGEWIHYQYTNFNEPMKKDLLNDIIEQDFEVYYAIWTDKGLIYVAKMNENGEMVLI